VLVNLDYIVNISNTGLSKKELYQKCAFYTVRVGCNRNASSTRGPSILDRDALASFYRHAESTIDVKAGLKNKGIGKLMLLLRK